MKGCLGVVPGLCLIQGLFGSPPQRSSCLTPEYWGQAEPWRDGSAACLLSSLGHWNFCMLCNSWKQISRTFCARACCSCSCQEADVRQKCSPFELFKAFATFSQILAHTSLSPLKFLPVISVNYVALWWQITWYCYILGHSESAAKSCVLDIQG